MRVYNFSAGPSCLPEDVLKQASAEMLDYQGSGQSVMEMSHRSKVYESIIEGAEAIIRENLKLTPDYHVLFLQGGAWQQFDMIPMNFLTKNKRADFTLTGQWAQKAYEEAGKAGKANLVGSSKDKKFSYIPEIAGADKEADYLHICYNNTIEGTQYHEIPKTTVPLITDASSGIMSKEVDWTKFAVIYAGAQKNLGPAGVTLVIIRKDMLDRIPADIPTFFNYKTHVENKSMFNTPPCYSIYILKLVQEWVKKIGGPAALYKKNEDKAKVLYDYLDSSKFFYSPVLKKDRSLMNVPFITRVEDPEKAEAVNKQFVKEAEAAGLVNLAGHRSVGGMRASIYNGMPLEGVKKLVDFLKAFEKKNS